MAVGGEVRFTVSSPVNPGPPCPQSPPPAVTALLFKMEEANLASRAKAQELIQATNQVGSPGKRPHSPFSCPLPWVRRGTTTPSRPWGKILARSGACYPWDCWEIGVEIIGVHVSSFPPLPFVHPPTLPQILSHRKPPSSLGVTPAPVPTSLGLPPGPSSYLLPGSLPLGGCGSTPPTPTGLAAASDKREGSSSSEGRGDTDKVSWAWERGDDGDSFAENTSRY